MRYTMYYEENDTIDDEKYDLLKQRLLLEQPKKKFESYTIKKQRFVGTCVILTGSKRPCQGQSMW